MNEEDKTLKFACFGAGFWSRYQLAGWREIPGAECIAVYNRTKEKAEQLARDFGIERVYDDPEKLLDDENLDFLDILTNVETHAPLTLLAAERRLPVICQKPMAPGLSTAEKMLVACEQAGVPLLINENWRWQTQIRAFKEKLNSGIIGRPWRATVIYNSSFPVFQNQPSLKELEQFILTDIGTHILDVVRCLFGEVQSLYCHTHKVHQDIRGEDAATVIMKMVSGMSVVAEMSYATRWSRERFPQTYITVEGEDASLELDFDYWIRLTTSEGIFSWRFPPPFYAWADARYDTVHSSIVNCQENLLDALKGRVPAETTAKDNFETLRLVYASYDSAQDNRLIQIN